jgi:hypothetical protein
VFFRPVVTINLYEPFRNSFTTSRNSDGGNQPSTTSKSAFTLEDRESLSFNKYAQEITRINRAKKNKKNLILFSSLRLNITNIIFV